MCPVCEKPQYAKKLRKVVAHLDQEAKWFVHETSNEYLVNGLTAPHFFDFDEVEIGNCSLDDINTFCIKAGNDPYLSARENNVRYRLLPGCELPDGARSNLEKVFLS